MDGRKNNGGHSTKSKSLNDKRLNPAKKLLSKYINDELNYSKLKKLMNKLYNDGIAGDTKSSTIFLSYTLGKPQESVDITTDGEKINSYDLSKASDAEIDALMAIYKKDE